MLLNEEGESPAAASRRRRGEDKGRAAAPIPAKERQRPCNWLYKLGGWSNGRTPGVTVAAIPVRIRVPPIGPNKRGQGVPAPRPLISTPGLAP